MKNILCPTDFSEAANNAIDHAANWAVHLLAEITLLKIIEASTMQDMANFTHGVKLTIEDREREEEKEMEKYCKALEEEYSVKCTARSKAYSSGIPHALAKEIEQSDCDMVVMGTNGADSMGQFYFGTNTFKVIEAAKKPLLMIPDGCGYSKPQRVVFAMDYGKDDTGAIEKLLEIVGGYNPAIILLHVSEDDTSISKDVFRAVQSEIEEKLPNDRFIFKRVVDEDPALAIDRFMEDNNADMLAIVNHKHGFFNKMFHSGVARKLSYIAEYPMLAI